VRKYDIQQKVQVVLNDEKTANALITKIRHTKKKIQQDHRAGSKSFILRKKEQICQEKMNRIAGSFKKKKIPVSAGLAVSPLEEKHSWYTDEQARKFFKTNVQKIPKGKVNYEEIMCEHAYVDPMQLII
jgi:hypothetical protein